MIQFSAEMEEWISTRPPIIQEMVRKYPPAWYRVKEGAPYGVSCPGTRVMLYSYFEDGKVRVIVRAKDKLPYAIEFVRMRLAEHGKADDPSLHAADVEVVIDPEWLEFLEPYTDEQEDDCGLLQILLPGLATHRRYAVVYYPRG